MSVNNTVNDKKRVNRIELLTQRVVAATLAPSDLEFLESVKHQVGFSPRQRAIIDCIWMKDMLPEGVGV